MPERVDLVVVVDFDDLHVHVVAERFGGVLDELEGDVYANAHVRRDQERHGGGGLLDGLEARGVEAGGADDERLAVANAHVELGERGFGDAEVHEHVEVVGCGGCICADRHVDCPDAGHRASIRTDVCRGRIFQSRP